MHPLTVAELDADINELGTRLEELEREEGPGARWRPGGQRLKVEIEQDREDK